MSTLRVNTIQNSGGTGSPEINGLARAWVNFNGTGTVAIRASNNVSSITDNGTGNYIVNFTTAMPDENYVVSLGSGGGAEGLGVACGRSGVRTTSAVSVGSFSYNSGTANDITQFNMAIFR
jgi:hypothetical protein